MVHEPQSAKATLPWVSSVVLLILIPIRITIPIRISACGRLSPMRRPASKLETNIARNLKKYRGTMSQVQFSKKLGIAQSTLNRIENLEASPTVNLLEKIAARLKVTVASLLK